MRIAVKKINEPLEVIDIDVKYKGECAEKIIENCSVAEFVRLNHLGTLSVGIDEDGLLKELPTNFLLEVSSRNYPIQKLIGTAFFIRTKYSKKGYGYDYELEDITEEDIIGINCILAEEYQKELKARFKDYKYSLDIIDTIIL